MGRRLIRAGLPALLAAAGVVLVIYGAMFHSAPVTEEQVAEVSIVVPTPFSPGPPGAGQVPPGTGPPLAGPLGFRNQPPFPGPPILRKTVRRKVLVTKNEFEPVLMRDVTVGGLTLLPSGELRRTYTGQPPSLCPT